MLLIQITGTGYGRTGGSGRLVKNLIISGSGGSSSGGSGNVGIAGQHTGRGISSSGGHAITQIKRPISGSGGSSSLGLANLHKSRELGVDPVVYGADTFCLFYPPVTFNYVDQEPGAFVTSEAEIRGLVTGVEQLGSMLQMAFVGEPVDIRWFGATTGVDDWGDGFHVSPPGFVHTYTVAGLYLIKRTASDTVSVKAARIMKVVERGNGSGTGGTIGTDVPIYLHPEPYGITIDPVIEGTIEGTFGMRFSLRTNGHAYPAELNVGRTEPRGGLAVFAETYENGVKDPQTKLVAAGFMTERTLDLDPSTGNLSGIAYDPLYWLNLQNMRDQYYTNTSYLGLQGLQDTNQQYTLGSLDCSTPTPPLGQEPTDTINVPALDLALLGYVPEHVLANCNPIFAAAHVLQHVRVTVPYFTGFQMYNLPTSSPYGNLGQFTNISVPPGFDELQALGGFHGFPVPQGNVLPNVRTLLLNMGATFHSRSDGTLVFDYKPFYKTQLPPAVYALDVPRAISPVKVGEGTPLPIFRVQVQKPLLGFTSADLSLPNNGQYPLNPATGEPASLSDLGILMASRAYQNGLLGVSAAEWSTWYRAVAQPLYAAAGSPQTVDLNNWDYYNDSLDQRNSIWEVQVGDPGGLIIGPIQNVFASDLQTFAVGVAKERAAHWQIQLPLGNAYHINLGDVVYLNYVNSAMQLNWSLKPFWVISLRQILNSSRYTRQVTLLEINPEEVVVQTP